MEYTYGYLRVFHDLISKQVSEGTLEWMVKTARAKAGGESYPSNQLLSSDHIAEGVTDTDLYIRVFNACARLLGHDLADQVAREAVGTAVAVQSETEPDDLTVTESDLEGLTVDQVALFMWGMGHVQEIYGPDKQPPDYVPKAKRRKWSAMANALIKKGLPENVIFGIVNAKYVEKK